MSRRDAGRRLVVDDGDGLDPVRRSAVSLLVHQRGIDAVTPVAGDEVDDQAEPLRHLRPERRELAGLEHQHGIAGRQRVDERRFPCAGARRWIHDDRAGGLKHSLQAGRASRARRGKRRAAMIDRRLRDGAQDAIGHVGRPGNLEEVVGPASSLECSISRRMKILAGRSRVATRLGIVAASQPLAAQAGAQILERGGHAVDAAIATNAVMGVVEPDMNGIGGDLFAMVYEARRRAARAECRRLGAGRPDAGRAEVAGLRGDAVRRHPHRDRPGRRRRLGGAALEIRPPRRSQTCWRRRSFTRSKDFPFPTSSPRAGPRGRTSSRPTRTPRAPICRTAAPRGPASCFSNPDLATSLRAIADRGAAGFYEGPTADAILAASRGRGGWLTAADLRDYEPEWVDPISTTYRGWSVYELPPNTQGIAALMMLDLMEQFPLRDYGLHSARALHVMIEAKKLAYADMLRYVGDPHFGDLPVAAMLDKAYARSRAHADSRRRGGARASSASFFDGVTNRAGGDTIYLSAIDRDGNIVSLIQSIYHGFGSGIVPPGTGFALHNRGALFTLEEGHPNALAPRKRPLHTIIPAFMQRGDVRIGFGIMGGCNQAQAHAQFVANIVDYDLDIQEALEAGRFTKATFDGADVAIEAQRAGVGRRRELAALGHEITVVPRRTGTFGSGQAVMSDGAGVHFGASEPRHDGAAIPEGAPLRS